MKTFKSVLISLILSLLTLAGLSVSATPVSLNFNMIYSPQFIKVFTAGSIVYANSVFEAWVSSDGGATFSPFVANGLPSGSLLDSVSGNNFYAVAYNGSSYQLYVSTDGGINFALSTLGGQQEIPAVASSGNSVYVATWQGLAYSSDAGVTWKWALSGILQNVFVSGSNVYVSTWDQGIAVSTNGGTSFTSYTTTNGLASNSVRSVYASGSNIFVATSSGLSISTNGGSTFSKYTGADLGGVVTDVSGSGNLIVASTNSYGVSVSLNNGASFTNYSTPTGLGNSYVYSLSVSPTAIYAATLSGVSKSINDGAHFSNYAGNGLTGGYLYSVAVSGNTMVAGSLGSGLSVSTNAGLNFVTHTASNSGIGSNMIHNAVISGSLIAAGTDIGLAISTNNGTTFTNYRYGGLANGVSALAISGSTIYAANYCSAQFGCGTNTGIYISSNNGLTFKLTQIYSGGKAMFISQIYVVGSTVYATSTSHGLFISTNSGATFSQAAATFPVGSPGLALMVDSANNIYVGEGAGIAISTNGGASFTTYPACPGSQSPIGISEVSGTLYVSCNSGLYASDNGGSSFVSVGSYPGIKGAVLTAPVIAGNDVYLGTNFGIAYAPLMLRMHFHPL